MEIGCSPVFLCPYTGVTACPDPVWQIGVLFSCLVFSSNGCYCAIAMTLKAGLQALVHVNVVVDFLKCVCVPVMANIVCCTLDTCTCIQSAEPVLAIVHSCGTGT